MSSWLFMMGEALGRLAKAQTATEARQAIAERSQLLTDEMLSFARDMLAEAREIDDQQVVISVEPALSLLEAIHADGLEAALQAYFDQPIR